MSETLSCFACGGEMKRDVRKVTYSYRDRIISFDQPGYYCQNCDESILTEDDVRSTEPLLKNFKRDVANLLPPAEIKRIRSEQGLTQAKAGEIFGGGSQAFSKYERGLILQSKPLDILLRILDRRRMSVLDIEHISNPSNIVDFKNIKFKQGAIESDSTTYETTGSNRYMMPGTLPEASNG